MYIVELDSHAVRGLSLHKIALLPSTKRASVFLLPGSPGWLIIPNERRAETRILREFRRSKRKEGLRAYFFFFSLGEHDFFENEGKINRLVHLNRNV